MINKQREQIQEYGLKEYYTDYLYASINQNQFKTSKDAVKCRKALKKIYKRMKKIDYDTFGYLAANHINFLLSLIEQEYDDPIYELIMEAISVISKHKSLSDDGEHIGNIHENSFASAIPMFGSNLIPSVSKLKSSKNINWIKKLSMELTIVEDGTIWINSELWNYLIDTLGNEAFGRGARIYYDEEQILTKISSVDMNIGFDNDKLILCFDVGPSSCLKIKFNKRINRQKQPFGVANNSMELSLSLNKNMVGTYIMNETDIPGCLIGKRDIETVK